MKAFVTDASGSVFELPEALEWKLEYGIGTPCDSFFLRCPWKMGLGGKPEEWTRFHAEHGGKRVFTGVVDEFEVSLGAQGCVLELSGRGMAALLLDNEALGQDYQLAALKEILREHVEAYGIRVHTDGQELYVPRFRVDTGSSEWTVLDEFLRACDGGQPRFDADGRLVLGAWRDDTCLNITTETPMTGFVRRESRYGVLSEILVRDRYSGQVQSVKNESFCAIGGRARRVLTMPGHAAAAEMRRAGQEQLDRSARERKVLEVELPTPFAAMPGELVSIQRYGFDDNGVYRVLRSAVELDTAGYRTRLTLLPREMM